jgi:hypothetical protein
MTAMIERRGRIFRKYALIVVLVVAGALITSGATQTYFAYQENKEQLGGVQREKAVTAAIYIQQFVQGTLQSIEGAVPPPWLGAASPATTCPDPDRRQEYLALLRRVSAITEVGYIDGQGKEQIRLSRLARDVNCSGQDFSQDAKFVQAKANRVYYSPVYFRNDSEPYMTIAFGETGPTAGVTVAEVNLKFLWDVVTQYKVGESGASYVVDSAGYLVAHPDISRVLQKTDLSDLPLVQRARSQPLPPGTPSEVAEGEDFLGRRVLSAYQPVTPPGWFVFVDQPVE